MQYGRFSLVQCYYPDRKAPGMLAQDYMPSSAFDDGAVSNAIDRLRSDELVVCSAELSFHGITRQVHCLATPDKMMLMIDELQAWADQGMKSQVFSNFDVMFVGADERVGDFFNTKVWFGILDGFAWSLDYEYLRQFVRQYELCKAYA